MAARVIVNPMDIADLFQDGALAVFEFLSQQGLILEEMGEGRGVVVLLVFRLVTHHILMSKTRFESKKSKKFRSPEVDLSLWIAVIHVFCHHTRF